MDWQPVNPRHPTSPGKHLFRAERDRVSDFRRPTRFAEEACDDVASHAIGYGGSRCPNALIVARVRESICMYLPWLLGSYFICIIGFMGVLICGAVFFYVYPAGGVWWYRYKRHLLATLFFFACLFVFGGLLLSYF